jgi:kynurenine formamidase
MSLCVQTSGSNAAGNFYAAGTFSCAEHGGTHVDAPFHFDETGRTVDRLPLSELVGRCRVVRTFALDCADQEVSAASASASPEQRNGTVAAILAHEAEHGLIPAGAVVCFHTGWGPRYSQGRLAYLGWDGPASAYDAATTALSFPGVEPEAARLRKILRLAP